ncbi:MAG: hypothetical protein ABL986_16305 [Vicinamibacterales bacterium]
MTVNSPIRMGQTAQATGTAALSNGQTQSITTGFQSDQPAIAAVTTAGVVSGLSNGRATIFVVSGGRQGQQVVRVVPDYQGRWSGTHTAWQVNSARVGELTGAINDIWRVQGVSGEGRVGYTLVSATRTSATPLTASRDQKRRVWERLAGARH